MSKCAPFLVLLIVAYCPLNAAALTVEEAYQAIPHQRTLFDASASKLPAAHSGALKQLFDFADRGVVLRVEGLMALGPGSNGSMQNVMTGYRMLSNALASLQVPKDIKPAQDLVLQSMQLHQRYFEARVREKEAGAKIDLAYRQNRDVVLASQKLQAAYAVLMSNYPNEPAVNQQAFYDYLCALDFL